MGTLGCINDMLQRDKENRELRKLSPPFNMAALFSHQIRSHLSPPTVLTVKVSSSVPLPRPSFRRTLNTASPVRNFGEACTMTL